MENVTYTATMQTADQRLKQHIEAIEKREADKQEVVDDIKDIYQLIKSEGYDCKAVRQVVRLRKMEAQERHEQEELVELYKCAVGLE